MIAALIGWVVMVVISAGLAVGGFFFMLIGAHTDDKAAFVMTFIFWMIGAGFGYGAWCNMPFKIVWLL